MRPWMPLIGLLNAIALAACSIPTYRWTHPHADESQFNADSGYCKMQAHSAVQDPVIAPPPTQQATPQYPSRSSSTFSGYTSDGRYIHGQSDTSYRGSYADSYANMIQNQQAMDQYRRYADNATRNAERARNNVFNGCMQSKGWSYVQVDTTPTTVTNSKQGEATDQTQMEMLALYGKQAQIKYDVELHKSPNSSKRLGVLPRGSYVTVAIQKNGWLKVEQSTGLHGWIPSEAASIEN